MGGTIKDVARLAGVSPQTVSNVIHSHPNVRSRTREKVLNAMEELQYTPNAAARSLVTQKTNTLGLVLTNIRNPIYGEISEVITGVADRYGYLVMIGNTKRDQASETRIVQALVSQRVDGVLLASPTGESANTKVLENAGVKVVRILYHPPDLAADYYGAQNSRGMRLATEHLISTGHKEMGMITGAGSSLGNQRLQGFRDAMAMHQLEVNENRIVNGHFYREGGRKATLALLKKHPRITALVCASDLMAIGAIDAVYELGLQVPKDIAVVGFDDIFTSSMKPLGLTTVSFDLEGLAEQAILRLLKKIEDKDYDPALKYYEVPCRLIIRESSNYRRP